MRPGVVKDLGDRVAQRFQSRVLGPAATGVLVAFRADRPIERGQMGMLAHQPARLVQHRREAIDHAVGCAAADRSRGIEIRSMSSTAASSNSDLFGK